MMRMSRVVERVTGGWRWRARCVCGAVALCCAGQQARRLRWTRASRCPPSSPRSRRSSPSSSSPTLSPHPGPLPPPAACPLCAGPPYLADLPTPASASSLPRRSSASTSSCLRRRGELHAAGSSRRRARLRLCWTRRLEDGAQPAVSRLCEPGGSGRRRLPRRRTCASRLLCCFRTRRWSPCPASCVLAAARARFSPAEAAVVALRRYQSCSSASSPLFLPLSLAPLAMNVLKKVDAAISVKHEAGWNANVSTRWSNAGALALSRSCASSF